MAILRRDDSVLNTLGNAIAGASVYYLTQPANVPALIPLANVYSNTTGTPAANPQITDGFGHAVAYLNDGQLYTVVYVYPNGTQVVYPDQFVGSSSGGVAPFAGIPTGTIDGTNTVFTVVNGSTPLTAIPAQLLATFNGILLTPGLGYTVAVVGGQLKITYAVAPQPASGSVPADSLYCRGSL
jgi:hypothetical protein